MISIEQVRYMVRLHPSAKWLAQPVSYHGERWFAMWDVGEVEQAVRFASGRSTPGDTALLIQGPEKSKFAKSLADVGILVLNGPNNTIR